MPIKIRHHEQPAGTQHAPDFGKGILRVGQVVQHHIDAGEIRLAVPQRKVAEFPDAQRDALGFPSTRKPPPGKLQHPRRAVHPDDLPARPRIRSSTIPVPHPRSTEVSQPSGIVSHTAPARSNPPSTSRLRVSQCSAMVLKNCRVLSARSSMILAAISTSARISASSSRRAWRLSEKRRPPLPSQKNKTPTARPGARKQPRFGQDLEVARNPRLAHFEDAYQFIDGSSSPLKNIGSLSLVSSDSALK